MRLSKIRTIFEKPFQKQTKNIREAQYKCQRGFPIIFDDSFVSLFCERLNGESRFLPCFLQFLKKFGLILHFL